MKCKCCGSGQHTHQTIRTSDYTICTCCGFMCTATSEKAQLVHHYRDRDPHERVAAAKGAFFKTALDYLSDRVHDPRRSILDIGCGYGYFLEHAAEREWVPYGVELVEDAVAGARERVGTDQIYHGSLRAAAYPSEMFHALTVWDVLVHMDDPLAELKECYRILKPDGRIGIRVRNVVFQRKVYSAYRLAYPVAWMVGMKAPYVFHSQCFTPKSLQCLLDHAGFHRVQILNSPLSEGDPYAYTSFSWLTASAKICVDAMAGTLYAMSGGRWVFGPSLLVWAAKP